MDSHDRNTIGIVQRIRYMIFSHHLWVFTLLFIGFFPFEVKSAANDVCSNKFCKEKADNSRCRTSWDECHCKDELITCGNLYQKPFIYDFFKLANVGYKLILRYHDLSLDQVVKYFGEKISKNDLTVFFLTNQCKDEVKISEKISLTVDDFNLQPNLIELTLQNNCLKDIKGNFSGYFQKLKILDISKNAIEKLNLDVFQGLQQLESLNLRFNRIRNISRSLFKDLKNLKSLDLCNNGIENLSEDIFHDLLNLEMLSICNNKALNQIFPKQFIRNTLLENLILYGNALYELPADVFSNLSQLKKLNLQKNNLISVSDKLFLNLHSLCYVYFSKNQLKEIPKDLFFSNKKIREIELSGNRFSNVPEIRLDTHEESKIFLRNCNISFISDLPVVNVKKELILVMSDNCINQTQKEISDQRIKFSNFVCKNCCLKTIPTSVLLSTSINIDLSYNQISKIDLLTVLNQVKSRSVNLNDNPIETINMIGISTDFRRDSNTTFLIQNPRFNCDCNLNSFVNFTKYVMQFNLTNNLGFKLEMGKNVICNQPESLKNRPLVDLKIMDLTCDIKEECPSQCRCDYQAEDSSVVVNCKNKGLKLFPDLKNISHPMKVHLENNKIENLEGKSSIVWNNIKELYLTNNQITSLRNLTVSERLRTLYVDKNELKQVENVLLNILRSTKPVQLKLAENPWDCCSIGVAKQDILTNDSSVIDSNNIKCIAVKNGISQPTFLTDATDQDLCLNIISDAGIKEGLISVAVLSLIICVIIIGVYRYKAEIQHWMFVHNICLNLVSEEDIDVNKKYDAFVSYSEKDDYWVASVLVPGLERGPPPYTLCLHQRDWLGGEWITDQIVRSVEQSRRTIIVLTDNFVESHWSKLEFIAAYQQMMKDKVTRIIIVVPFDLPDLSRLDDDLRVFVTMNTYVKWNQAYFWRKLRCSMPRIKKKSNEDRY